MRISLVGPVPIKDASRLLSNVDDKYFDKFSNDRGISVLTTAKALLNRGHIVSLITTDINTEHIEIFENGAFRLIIVPRRKNKRAQVADFYRQERKLLSRVIESEASEVVNSQWTYEYALASLKTSRSTVITVHDAPLSMFLSFRDLLRFLHLLIAIRLRLSAPKLIFVSPFIAKRWRREMLWRGNIDIVPNIAPVNSSVERDENNFRNCISVTESGRLKNASALIDAWPMVISICPDAVLTLVGHGMEVGGKLHKLTSDRGLNFGIRWLGFMNHEQVLEEIGKSRLLISTSRQESFGLTLLEAMSFGIPVVAGASSGAPAWVLANAGILVDINKPEEISSAIIEILRNEILWKDLASAALFRAVSEFSQERVCEKLEEIYREIAHA